MPNISVKEISKDLYLLRVDDTRTRYFEALWEIPEGITYNAYLLKTPEGAVLFDGWKRIYEDEFVKTLTSLVSPDEIKHIVIHHMEPDHSGTLPRVLDMVGEDVTIWGHPFVKKLMESLYGLTPAHFQAVKSGNTLEFGGRILAFYHATWLHWPETMVTHIPAENILLTGDIFGGYSMPEGIFDDQVDTTAYLNFARKYTVSVIGFYRDKIGKNIAALQEKHGVQPAMILPAHGLLWRREPQRIIQAYLDWGAGKPQPGKVTVVYSSMYRYVEKAIGVAVEELRAQGYQPVVHRLVDDDRAALADILSDIADSEAVVLGTETYESDVFPYTTFILSEVLKKADFPKPLLVLAVFGWAAAAGRQLSGLLEKSAFDPVQILELKGLLSAEGEQKIRKEIRNLKHAR